MYYIYKNRIYIKNPSEAPKGVKVQEGKRGGIYYESSFQESSKPNKFQEQTYEEIYGKEIEIIIDVPKEIIDRYKNEEQKLNQPIPLITFKNLIQDASNSIQKELLGTKIYILPYSMDCWGFADPRNENVIFIPSYDISFTYPNKTVYEIYGFKEIEERLDKILLQDEKKIFNEWKTLTKNDAIQKTLFHEKGHIETYKLLEQKSGKKEYAKYWKPIEKRTANGKYVENWDYSNIEFFLKLFKDYITIPEVLQNLEKIDDVRIRAYQLGEMIAEDYRLLKGGKQSIIPNKYFWYFDLTRPEVKDKRHEILKKVFGW